MNEKRIGNIEVTTFPDSESVALKFWRNSGVSDALTLSSAQDLYDLQYAIQCVMSERARRGEKRG
jgi:hypothetical protein